MKILLMLTILTLPVLAQPQGTVDGIPIPSRAFAYPRAQVEVAWRLENKRSIEKEDLSTIDHLVQARRCASLKGEIDGMLRDRVLKEMVTVVTPDDIARAKATAPFYPADPAEAVRMHHEHASAILAGLDALLNKHEDSQAVYNQYLKPHGITEQEWASQIITSQMEGGKKGLMNEMAMTVEGETQLRSRVDWSGPARQLKLNQLIDDQIAQSDPHFKQYLAEYSQAAVVEHGVSRGMPGDHLNYLNKQRQAFWNAIHRKAQVVINEPTMQTCDLSEYNGGTKPR
jgi:hypothetical protein